MNTEISLSYLASALGGAGLVLLNSDFNKALWLVGAAVVLLVGKAILNKNGVPVSAKRSR